MDVTVEIDKKSCNHIEIIFSSGGKSISRVYTLPQLKAATSTEDVSEAIEMVLVQTKKIVKDNPEASLQELKTLIEAETFYA